ELVGAQNKLAHPVAEQGRSDEAMPYFQEALRLDPNLVEACVNFGTTLLQQGKLEAASAQFERALAINPNFADAHANLGNVLLAEGRLDEAAQRYERALALKPDLPEAYNNLGIVLAARGDFPAACRRFEAALARKAAAAIGARAIRWRHTRRARRQSPPALPDAIRGDRRRRAGTAAHRLAVRHARTCFRARRIAAARAGERSFRLRARAPVLSQRAGVRPYRERIRGSGAVAGLGGCGPRLGRRDWRISPDRKSVV